MNAVPGRHARWFVDGTATVGVVLTFALLAVVGLAALLSLEQVETTARQVEHTHAVLRAVDALQTAVVDAEADQRGYQLSGDDAYLAACRAALPRVQDAGLDLGSLTEDQPGQHERLHRLLPLLDRWRADLRAALERPDGHINPAAERPFRVEDKQRDADVRTLLTRLRDEELVLLAQWSRRSATAGMWLSLTTTVASALAVGAAVGAALVVQRNTRRRHEAEAALRRHEAAQRQREQDTLRHALVEAEAARHRADELVRGVFRAAPLGVVALDLAGRVQLWNPAAERAFGWSATDVLGQPYPLVPPGKEAEFAELFDRAVRGESLLDVETQRHGKAGQPLDVSVSAAPLRDVAGVVGGVLVVLADVTARKALEAEVRRAQKLEAVGRLAGGIAHDFNNLLTVINGCCDLLLLHRAPDDPERELVEAVHSAGERAAALTRQLLAFGRRQILQPRPLDLNVVVADFAPLLGRLIGEDVTLEYGLEPAGAPVCGDRVQLEQVIMNLALNGRDAMPQGGRLDITTQTSALDARSAAQLELKPGPYVLLVVRDSGIGMDAQVRAHVFEPFFTTKGPGKGTGLGLATVYAVVQQAGGAIDFTTAPGEGTTVRVYLPRLESSEPAALPECGAPVPGGAETVLVVEDDPRVRKLVGEVLRSRGYTVLDAGNGIEALRVASSHAGPIHLLLTDVVMPHLSGRALAEHLASLRPALKVLYLSGYADEAIVRHGVQLGAAFLQKPFTPEALAAEVRARLAEAAPRGRPASEKK